MGNVGAVEVGNVKAVEVGNVEAVEVGNVDAVKVCTPRFQKPMVFLWKYQLFVKSILGPLEAPP